MSKRSRSASTSSISVPNDLVKEIQTLRPLRLFIQKRKKKGDDANPMAIRVKFLHLSIEKKMKYFQKSIDKYLELLEEKNISEETQSQGKLFDDLFSKKEQKEFFEYLNSPRKPLNTAAAYYSQTHKDQPDENAKPWKNLSNDEKQTYTQMLNEARDEYQSQLKNFIANLPARLRIDFRNFLNENSTEAIAERRKSVQFADETHHHHHQQQQQHKLTRHQLDELHKCRPSEIYYEKKVDEKPVFINTTARNTYVRSIFKELSEKKRKKFVLKATDQWREFLEANPSICDEQIPTLHLILTKNEEILHFFTSLGLPNRPPNSALLLFNNERDQNGSQEVWTNLSQTTKDDFIKRLHKMKNDYHVNFVHFVENVLPSDYFRFEFFRNVKFASKDYETATKDRPGEKIDDGQLKITQYLKKKSSTVEESKRDEFDRITRQLIGTKLNNEQKNLVEKLSKLMKQMLGENDVVLLNGHEKKKRSNDDVDDDQVTETTTKKKKKKSK